MLANRDASLPDVELTAELPDELRPAALVTFEEKVRDDAAETLRYFARQGVILKVISGDNPRTVGAVAARRPRRRRPGRRRAELTDDDEELAEAVEANTVFGRVTPHQKRRIVGALQSRGHTVAMTGDGVNDALALKDADIGIAMGNGAPATRAVAQLVLLDSNFATMPGIVAEGRRVIANVERVANLFVTKTVYAVLLAVAVGVARWPYPFLPRHLTVVSSVTIGIPAFLLALAPNAARSRPGFVPRVLRFAIPAGTIVAIATFVAYWLSRDRNHLSLTDSRTTATIVLLAVGLSVLALLARPLTPAAIALVVAMTASVGLLFALPTTRRFYALGLPPGRALGLGRGDLRDRVRGLEGWWMIDQRSRPPEDRTRRFTPRARRPRARAREVSCVSRRPDRSGDRRRRGGGRLHRCRRSRRGGRRALRHRAHEDDVGNHVVVPRVAFADLLVAGLVDDPEEGDVVTRVSLGEIEDLVRLQLRALVGRVDLRILRRARHDAGRERRRLDDVDAAHRR